MLLKVSQFNRADGSYTLLVTFNLKGGKVKADWQAGSGWFKEDLEHNGIVTADGQFFPKDGKKFFDALPLAFSNSSVIIVHEGTMPPKFADSGFDFMTVYDENGKQIEPK